MAPRFRYNASRLIHEAPPNGSGPQLYDLSKDIKEKTNLAEQHPEIVERLKKSLLDWRKTLPVEPYNKAKGAGGATGDQTYLKNDEG